MMFIIQLLSFEFFLRPPPKPQIQISKPESETRLPASAGVLLYHRGVHFSGAGQ
jgi:hypothetical protein